MTRKQLRTFGHIRAFRALLLAGAAFVAAGACATAARAQSHADHHRPRLNLVQAQTGTPTPSPPAGHGAHQVGPAATAPAPAAAPAAPRRNELGGSIPDLPRGAAAPTSADTPPLLGTLGALSWPAGTANPEAQAYFDQGYRLAWGFNHAEAARAFRAAQRLDPDCAMCLWGEAWVLGPHINFIMEEDANRRAVAALERARALAPKAGEMRAALIDALSKRYSADPKADRKALDQAYADAMEAVQARWPADPEIAVLTADALMNLSPWDYWEDNGRKAKGATDRIVALLEAVLGDRRSADRAEPAAPRRDPPLHPHRRGLGPAGARGPARGAAGSADARRRPHRPHAGAHLVPARHVEGEPGVEPPRGRGGRGATRPRRRQRALRRRLLRAQRPLRPRLRHDGRRRADGGGGGDAPRHPHPGRGETRLPGADPAGRVGALPGACPLLDARSGARPASARPRNSRSSAPTGTTPAAKRWRGSGGSRRRARKRRRSPSSKERPPIAALPAEGVPAAEVLGIARRIVEARAAQAAGDHAARRPPLRRSGRGAGRAALHGAALLVLPRPPVARRGAAGARQARRGRGRLPRGAEALAQQRLGDGRALRAAEARSDARGAAAARAMLEKSWFGGPPPAVDRL